MKEFRVYVPEDTSGAFLEAVKKIPGVQVLSEKGQKHTPIEYNPAQYQVPEKSLGYFRNLPGKTGLGQMYQWQVLRTLWQSTGSHRTEVPFGWLAAVDPLHPRFKQKLTTALSNLRNIVPDLDHLRRLGLEDSLPPRSRSAYQLLSKLFASPNTLEVPGTKI